VTSSSKLQFNGALSEAYHTVKQAAGGKLQGLEKNEELKRQERRLHRDVKPLARMPRCAQAHLFERGHPKKMREEEEEMICGEADCRHNSTDFREIVSAADSEICKFTSLE
jgi:hypothetical protein